MDDDKPFHGLKFCVTGLSTYDRKMVEKTAIAFGGTYTPNLQPSCTHLIVQKLYGKKYEHAVKFGIKRGLKVVSFSWFVKSSILKTKINEKDYLLNGECDMITNANLINKENESCPKCLNSNTDNYKNVQLNHENYKNVTGFPQKSNVFDFACQTDISFSDEKSKKSVTENDKNQILYGFCFYLDTNLSNKVKEQVSTAIISEGGSISSELFVGSKVTHVVCELNAFQNYINMRISIVSSKWVIQSVEKKMLNQKVFLSPDFLLSLSNILNKPNHGENSFSKAKVNFESSPCSFPTNNSKKSLEINEILNERKRKVAEAKAGVRKRRKIPSQKGKDAFSIASPPLLLPNVCWSINQPPSKAKLFCDGFEGSMKPEPALLTPNPTPEPTFPSPSLNPEPEPLLLKPVKMEWHQVHVQGQEQERDFTSFVSENQTCSAGSEVRSVKIPTGCALDYAETPNQTESPNQTRGILGDSFIDPNVLPLVQTKPTGSFENFKTIPLSKRQLNEIVFRNAFITILFPIDRFSEMGVVSRTFFSHNGFNVEMMLNHIYEFYQENLSDEEMEVAIQTDSKHADALREMYWKWNKIVENNNNNKNNNSESNNSNNNVMKRFEFLGSRCYFEKLYKTNRNMDCHVYELHLLA